jgi:hypothetical protein
VTILFIQRLNKSIDGIQLLEFWGAWFTAARAEGVKVVRLAGAS